MDYQTKELNNLRRNAFIRIFILAAIEIVICALLVTKLYAFTFFIMVLVGLIYYFCGGMRPYQDYKWEVKNMIVGEAFDEQFQRIQTNFRTGMKKDTIRDTNLIMMGNTYRSDDFISGFYKGVSFTRADVYLADESRGGNDSHTIVYLKGRWMTFQFPKKMANDVQMIGQGFRHVNTKSSILVNKDNRRHKIELESAEFNRQFDVYAEFDEDAFYVLTPQMQERVMEYSHRVDGRVMLGIIDNKLHIAIKNSKNTMEPNVLKKPNFDQLRAEAQEEIDLIKDTIDLFLLDQEHYQG